MELFVRVSIKETLINEDNQNFWDKVNAIISNLIAIEFNSRSSPGWRLTDLRKWGGRSCVPFENKNGMAFKAFPSRPAF